MEDEILPRDRASPPGQSGRAGEQPTVRTPRAVEAAPEVPSGPVRKREVRSSTLDPGMVLASRYRIVRFIAKGGMGEVYEVEDLQLQERIALKTLRLEVAEDAGALERFRREIQIARKATHPNLCRIFDLGLDGGPVENGGLMFLTMELLAGETISGRLKRAGPFSTSDAVPLLAQIAAGLDALHAAGIVHRDFKPGNIILVPAEGGGLPRAVITDFGLARPVVSTESLQTISAPGMVMGTPAYMAPEQVRGDRVTVSADIYAFGIVAYEMVTKHLPFTGTSSWALAAKRLTDPPVPPSEHVPHLKGPWEDAVLVCLSLDPGQRFAKAMDFIRSIEGDPKPSIRSAPPVDTMAVTVTDTAVRAPRRTRRAFLSSTLARRAVGPTAVVGLAVAGLLFGAHLFRRPSAPAASAAAASPTVVVRRTVAVAPAAGAPELAVSWGVQNVLSAILEAGHGVRIVRSRDADRMVGRATSTGVGDAELRGIVRAELVADVLAIPIWSPTGGLGQVTIRLVDVVTGVPLAESSATGAPADLVGLVERAAAPLRKALGLPPLASSEEVALRAWFPATPEARQLLFSGTAALQGNDVARARATLEEAQKADPKNPAVQATLGEAYLLAGLPERAAEAARRAAAAAVSLDADMKRRLEARSAEISRDFDAAIELLGRQLGARPDDLEVGLKLTSTQLDGGRANEALVTLEKLRKLPDPLGKDPRLDVNEAYAQDALGDATAMMSAADRAVAASQATGRGSVLAAALFVRGMALSSLGNPAGAVSSIQEARAIFEKLGNEAGATRCLEQAADIVLRRGDAPGAERLFREAYVRYRASGNLVAQARVLQAIATTLLGQGKTAEAGKLYDQSLRTFRAAGARPEAALTLNSLGARLHLEGELAAARNRYQEALALYQELGDKAGTAQALTNYGETLVLSADLELAGKTYDEALALYRQTGDRSGSGYVQYREGELSLLRGDLAAAGDRLADALTEQSAAQDKVGAADTRIMMARVLLAEGKAGEAEAEARAAEELLRTLGATDRSAAALTVEGEALLAQGKLKEAAAAVRAAVDRARTSGGRLLGLEVQVAAASATVRTGTPEERAAALRQLEALRKDATGKGLKLLALEARLVAAQGFLAAGDTRVEADLKALIVEAKSKELGFLRRQAEELLGRLPGGAAGKS